ncbi:MAG: hypothetical protein HY882_01365 [Deltaproteobacteria bacterium]|nr:hypothetical protein [Deltaproteobacteria bacterium]
MNRKYQLLRNRDFLLLLAIALGLLWGQGAQWTEKTVIPALVVVMTVATMGVSGSVFLFPRSLLGPDLAGLALALFSDQTAIPATVSTIFMIVYIIWLSFQRLFRH